MELKSRLSRLKTQAGTTTPSPAARPSLSALRQRIAEMEARGRVIPRRQGGTPRGMAVGELADRVGGELLDGRLIRISQCLPLGEHGPGSPSSRRRPGSGRLATPDPGLRRDELQGDLRRYDAQENREPVIPLPGEADDGRRNVYIDTETTGLAGGSGTLAFLVGLAVVEDDVLRLTQFLIPRFGGEAAALAAFAEMLTGDDRLVSYNGKSYDLPLLITRYRMQALRHPFDGLPHLDLLHPVRRLFGHCWPDCRLTTMERRLLDIRRVDDLPGSEAPEAWFDYVRRGRGERLVRVVDHNRQDIVSLALAHRALGQVLQQPGEFDVDFHALARWHMESDELAARKLLRAHLERLCDDGLRLLALLERRAGHWRAAVALWEQLAARGCSDSLERLAKYHEHVSHDLAAARRYCERLPVDAAREHRRRRLERKLTR
ncbi:MAG TPA: hypothetical protein ENK05_14755 [Gammaproteobacteria bacterium]|nr:hypothetical protein [Gammaproteobacteria bacterium]